MSQNKNISMHIIYKRSKQLGKLNNFEHWTIKTKLKSETGEMSFCNTSMKKDPSKRPLLNIKKHIKQESQIKNIK